MGKLFLFVFVYAFSFSAWALDAPTITHQETIDGTIVQVDINGFEQKNVSSKEDGEFYDLDIPGQGTTTEVGAPKVPVIRFEIEVASDQVEVSVLNTHKSKSMSFVTPKKLAPYQESQEKTGHAVASFKMNKNAYGSKEFFPSDQARVVAIGSVRGHLIATVEVAPMQYVPSESKIHYQPQMQVLVRSVGNEKARAVTPKSPGTSFDKLNKHVLNYQVMPAAKKESLLMIVGKTFLGLPLDGKNWLSELVTTKTLLGYDVTMATTLETGDTADSIRSYIQRFYRASLRKSPLVYVMLIGDSGDIPAYNSGRQFTDNYYATIDTDTYAGDAIYRDIAVGRLPAKTEDELAVMVHKIVKYDNNKFSDLSWIKRIAWLGTDDRGHFHVAEGTHNYVIDTYTSRLGYTGNFPALNQAGGDKLYSISNNATTADVQKALDDGRSFVVYSGHGATTFWAGPEVRAREIGLLQHGDALPYVMSFACISGSFAGPVDSFGETWLKQYNGAIGFFGTSNNSYWDEDDVLEKVFFDGFFQDKIRNAGLTNTFGLNGVRKFYGGAGRTQYYFEIYNLLGDPTAELKN